MKKILSIFAAALFAVAVNAETIPVAAGENALRDAVASASAGDVLELASGNFAEVGDFSIDKNLTIKAAEGASPVIANTYYIKVDGGAEVTFQGIKFDGAGASDHCVRSHNNSTGAEVVTFDNCDFYNYPSHVIYVQRANRKWNSLIVRNCYFHDNKRSSIFVGYESGTDMACQAVTIENSIFANTVTPEGIEDRAVVAIYNAGSEAADIQVRVNHCTFYNFVKQSTGNSYSFLDVRKSTDVVISNCIFAQPAADMSGATYVYGGSIDNCLVFNGGHRSSSIVHNGVEGDPLFADAAHGDFYLLPNSPALTAGTDGGIIGACPAAEMKTLYCKMDKDWWKADGAAVGFYTWDDKGRQRAAWPGERMAAVEGEADLWKIDVNVARNHMGIFTRVSGEGEVYDWSSKTEDLTFPTDDKDMFTIANTEGCWSGCACDGVWSKYGEVVSDPKFYIAGNMTDWDNAKIPVYEDSYTFENMAEGKYQLKAVGADFAWHGMADMTTIADNLYLDQDGNVCFILAEAGNVTVNYKEGELFTLEGNFVAPEVQLIGSFFGPWDGETQPFALDPVDGTKAAKTVTLSVEWCDFKVIRAGDWLGKENEDGNYRIHSEHNWVDGLKRDYEGLKAISLQPDGAGDYTFTYEYANGKLTVTFPSEETAIHNAAVEAKAVKMMENGQLVIIKNGVKYNVLGTAL